MSELIENAGAFIEQDCTFTFNEQSFTSGGSWLAKRVDTGKYEGLLYAFDHEADGVKKVGTWDGSLKIRANFTNTWINNMGDRRQNVYFTHEVDGVKRYFHGIYYCENSDIVRIKEVKPW